MARARRHEEPAQVVHEAPRYTENCDIAVSVDDETYRRSRIRAAELDTSVSALVRTYTCRFLTGDAGPASTVAARATASSVALRHRDLDDVIGDFDARGVRLSRRDNLTREELYDEVTSRSAAFR